MKKLVIVQPYIPKYREKFFDLLFERLASNGIEGIVAAGTPEGQDLERGDSISTKWHTQISNRRVRILRHTLTLGGSYKTWRHADAVVVGHLGSSLDTYRALLASKNHNLRVGLWGHIRSYVNESHPVDAALERWQLRHADQVFAYTPGGSSYALAAGVKPGRITTVMNSVDTDSLVQAVQAITFDSLNAFLRTHKIDPLNTFSYIGGLDESKRISFLVEALDELWVLNPNIRILVAGQGNQSALLDPASRRGQVIKLGYADPELQALMAQSSRAILMPGRIGLIAVEALVLNLPIITTNWKYHSAEIEYLTEGTSLVTTPDNPAAYASSIFSLIGDGVLKGHPGRNGWTYPTIDGMVDNFATGVISMMTRNEK